MTNEHHPHHPPKEVTITLGGFSKQIPAEVTIPRRVVKPAMIALMAKAAEQLDLSQRETITLGLM